MAKRILKFGTGDFVPEGAIYLASLTNERMMDVKKIGANTLSTLREDEKRYVWHYFLVEVSES